MNKKSGSEPNIAQKAGPDKRLVFAAYAFFMAIVAVLLFIKLGNGPAIQTDEATHAVNAYEMLAHGNWLVNTYRYEVDYFNSKPPLSLWAIMLSYKAFGFNTFALRFASAVAALLQYFVISFWLYKRAGSIPMLFFAMAYPANTSLFEYHAFRAGDMDSLYMLFFTLAMIALAEMGKSAKMIYLYAAALGLAFLTKGIHAGVIFVAGLAAIPLYRKNIKVKEVVRAALVSLAIILAWAVPRFLYDGIKFFYDGFVNEVSGKVNAGDGGEGNVLPALLPEILKGKEWLLLYGFIALFVVCAVILKVRTGKTFKEAAVSLSGGLEDKFAIACIWTVLPAFLYLIVNSPMHWYLYPSWIGAGVLMSLLAGSVVRFLTGGCGAAGGESSASSDAAAGSKSSACSDAAAGSNASAINAGRIAAALLCAAVLALCLAVSVRMLQRLQLIDIGGNPIVAFRDDIQACYERSPEEMRGKRVYTDYVNRVYGQKGEWENDRVIYAEMIADMVCIDGGVEAFCEDKDAVLILDKRLWDQYADVLIGHVILEDNNYLIMTSHFYGE